MIKILHLIPTLEGGGAERQLATLAVEQARRGHEVHIGIRKGGIHEATLAGSAVQVHRLGDLRGLHPKLAIRIWRLLSSVQAEVVQTWLPQMDILGGAVAVATDAAWIVTERTSRTEYEGKPLSSRLRVALGSHASAVVANSAGGAEYWRGTLRSAPALRVVHNVVDVAAVRAAPPFQLPLTSGSAEILVIGRLIRSKGLSDILEAISLLPADRRLQVLIIGDGPMRGELEHRIRAHGQSERVTLLPYMADWWGLAKQAACLVSMSRYEGQPNVMLEAMAAQCPVIVSDIPAHREILDERSAMIVQIADVRGLAQAILDVCLDPEGARSRARRALERVQEMTIQAAADAYDDIYTRALSRTD